MIGQPYDHTSARPLFTVDKGSLNRDLDVSEYSSPWVVNS